MADAGAGFRRSLITPEGLDLNVELATAGQRVTALVVDVLLVTLGWLIALLILLYGMRELGDRGFPLLVFLASGLPLVRIAYFVAFEAGPLGATPGKRMVGLRVAARDGSGLSVDQVIARNLTREIEVFLPFTVAGAQGQMVAADGWMGLLGLGWALFFSFFLMFNRDRMRIGDLLAGTWVLRAQKPVRLAEIAETGRGTVLDFTEAQLDAYGIAELHKLEEVIRRANPEAERAVADTIVKRIGWTRPVPEPRPFLASYYRQLRDHLEREVLFGQRRADKFDV